METFGITQRFSRKVINHCQGISCWRYLLYIDCYNVHYRLSHHFRWTSKSDHFHVSWKRNETRRSVSTRKWKRRQVLRALSHSMVFPVPFSFFKLARQGGEMKHRFWDIFIFKLRAGRLWLARKGMFLLKTRIPIAHPTAPSPCDKIWPVFLSSRKPKRH